MAVAINDGRIVWVGPVADLPASASVIRLPGRLLLPGFANAHSHAFQRGLRGHVQYVSGGDSFWSWRERMYRLANALDPDGIEAVSALAFVEMVKAGFTSVGEFHYLQHNPDGTPYANPDELALRIVAAAATAGIHPVVLRVAYARPGFGAAPNPLQRRFLDRTPDDVLAAVSRLAAQGVDVGIAPHSIRAVPRAWMRSLASFRGPIHAHVDEQPAEISASLAEHSCRPLQVMADEGLVSERFVAVHFTHADNQERELMGRSGASICVCPTTELDLGDGFFPLQRYVRSRLCVGTDSHASIDPFLELRSLEWNARGLVGRRNVHMPNDTPDALASTLLHVGAREGARAIGLDAGELRVGARADLITLDVERIEFAATRLIPAAVFNGSPAAVTDVWVGGRRVVTDGHHPEAARVAERARKVLAALE